MNKLSCYREFAELFAEQDHTGICNRFKRMYEELREAILNYLHDKLKYSFSEAWNYVRAIRTYSYDCPLSKKPCPHKHKNSINPFCDNGCRFFNSKIYRTLDLCAHPEHQMGYFALLHQWIRKCKEAIARAYLISGDVSMEILNDLHALSLEETHHYFYNR